MSETLYVEGPDREAVCEQLLHEYGRNIRLISTERVRRGGMGGFFAREYVGVRFELTDSPTLGTEVAGGRHEPPVALTCADEDARSEFEARLFTARPAPPVSVPVAPVAPVAPAAPAAPSAPAAPAAPSRATNTPARTGANEAERTGRHSIAAGGVPLQDLIDRADLGDGDPRPAAPAAPTVSVTKFEPVGLEPATVEPEAVAPAAGQKPDQLLSPKTRIDALGELRALGIPIWMTPDAEDRGLYHAIEQVVLDLPKAPAPPSRAGEITALVGPIETAREAAVTLCAELRIPVEDVWIAGDPNARHSSRKISGPLDASRRATELRVGDVPAVVIVATGAPSPQERAYGWAAQVIAGLSPDAVWAVADASRKAEDTRSELHHVGAIDALVVHSAERTTSPASVWELDVPIALLDGRPATAGRWAALLFDRLAAHRAAGGPRFQHLLTTPDSVPIR